MKNHNESKTLGKVVQIDDTRIQDHLGELVRGTVEETLNSMLDAEADAMCGAQRYQRSADRVDTRAGHYDRQFHTKAGNVSLKVPKLRKQTFETAIIERYKRRETSIEESLIEMYLAGVSVRRVEDITEALWGTRVSSGTVSKLNKKVYKHIDAWRNRPIEGEHPYVYLDGIVLKRSWAGEVKNVSVLVAIGVDQDGFRCVLGVQEGHKEDKSGWSGFLKHLKQRGLKGVRLIISDACIGLVESVGDYYPEADWQRCTVHFYRNVFSHVPRGKMREVAAMLKAIHAQESYKSAETKAKQIVDDLREMKLGKAAELVEEKIDQTLTFYRYPQTHWIKLRTNNPMERIMREIRRRTRVVGAFPDGESAMMLVGARLRHIAGTTWGVRRYVSMDWLKQHDLETQHVG
jgi:transposase-like protein